MEKFEKNIKEKLENRRIEPTDDVWASIDQQLNKSRARQFKKRYFTYGIAAGMLTILGFLGINQLKITKDPVLNTPQQVSPSSADESENQPTRKAQLLVNELAKHKRTKHFSYDLKYDLLERVKQIDEFDDQPKRELLVKADSIQKSKGKKLLAEVEKELEVNELEQEVQKLVDLANQELSSPTDQEIASIDAEDLLQEAEFDIENETLKQKILLALEKKIDHAKNALTKL